MTSKLEITMNYIFVIYVYVYSIYSAIPWNQKMQILNYMSRINLYKLYFQVLRQGIPKQLFKIIRKKIYFFNRVKEERRFRLFC